MTTPHTLPAVHFFDPAFKADPFPAYAALREGAPVHPVPLPGGETVWLVTRYADALAVLRDPRFAKDMFAALTPEQLARQPRAGAGFRLLHRHLLSLDPPDHTRLRALVQTAFTPRYVETLRPRVQAIADDLLAALPQDRAFDLIGAYAFPLPLTVIAEMVGVPPAERDQFREWSAAVVSNPAPGPGASGEVLRVLAEFGDYLRAHLARLRRSPDDSLTSALLRVHQDGDRLDEDELLSMLWLLLVAGFETTVNLIGTGVLALLEHPEQLARLRSDPTLLPGAVEELLRFCGPVETSMLRWAREDVTLHGVTVPRGSAVVVGLASANRDPSHFAQPDDLDLAREVRGHVAFGHGVHSCLGAPLARLEGQIAFGTLLRRFPGLRLAASPGELRWKPGLLMRGLAELPVRT